MSRITAIAASAALVAGIGLAGPASAQSFSRTGTLDKAERYAVIDVAPLAAVEAGQTATVVLPMPAGPLELELTQFSMRAPDFQVFVQDEAGIRAVAAPPVRTVRGQIAGIDDSRVIGSISNGQFTGKIQGGPGETWINVTPLEQFEPGADGRQHVVLASSEIDLSEFECGVDDAFLISQGLDPISLEVLPPEPALPGGAVTPNGAADATKRPAEAGAALSIDPIDGHAFELQPEGVIDDRTDLLIDADFQFFTQSGSSVFNTVNDIENVMAGVDDVYQRDVDIAWEITGILVRTSSADNPYTSNNAETLLCQFVAEWNSGALTTIRRDVTHLFTGRSLSGTTIGIAFNGVICNVSAGNPCGGTQNLAYGLSESRFSGVFDARVSLTAHEIGHNYNAGHCTGGSCHIMCASVNGCGGTIGPDLIFGPTATSQIVSFRNTRNCLDPQTPAIEAPLDESWDSTTINTNLWNWFNADLAVVDTAIGEPSGPFSLELRNFGSLPFRDGDIRSTEMLLGGESGFVAQAMVAWTGVGAGQSLFIEGRDVSDNWVNLATVTSDGSDSGFIPIIAPLAPFMYHDKFRLRLRVDLSGFGGRFFVDDIRVGDLEVDPPCVGDLDGDDVIAFSDLLTVLSAFGDCPPGECPADLDGDETVGFSDVLTLLSAWGPCP